MSSQALKFRNFTDREFTWTFDSIPYTFKAGETIYMEEFKAKHFAKHLVDREMNILNIPTNMQVKRDELEKKCFTQEEAVSVSEALNIEETKKEGKKGKKEVKEEEAFADLQSEVTPKAKSKKE